MCINEIATICSVVRDDGWKKNGTNILRLRLTFRRQSRYIKTNILLRKNQLDRNGQIKDGSPDNFRVYRLKVRC